MGLTSLRGSEHNSSVISLMQFLHTSSIVESLIDAKLGLSICAVFPKSFCNRRHKLSLFAVSIDSVLSWFVSVTLISSFWISDS